MPLLVDLCCGLGGWSKGFVERGWDCLGFDVQAFPYPGQLVIQDVRTLDGARFRGARLIVASPPCQEFSRHDQPWTRARNPPPPDRSIWEACLRVAREAGVPLVLENVRGAQPFMGKAIARWGSQYLWGDGVPVLLPPRSPDRQKQSRSSRAVAERSLVPLALSRYLAEVYSL